MQDVYKRQGRFSPEQARALGVPVKQWKTLQHGESITLDGGRVIQPEAVLGPARQGLSFVFSGDTCLLYTSWGMRHLQHLFMSFYASSGHGAGSSRFPADFGRSLKIHSLCR